MFCYYLLLVTRNYSQYVNGFLLLHIIYLLNLREKQFVFLLT